MLKCLVLLISTKNEWHLPVLLTWLWLSRLKTQHAAYAILLLSFTSFLWPFRDPRFPFLLFSFYSSFLYLAVSHKQFTTSAIANCSAESSTQLTQQSFSFAILNDPHNIKPDLYPYHHRTKETTSITVTTIIDNIE